MLCKLERCEWRGASRDLDVAFADSAPKIGHIPPSPLNVKLTPGIREL